MTCPRTEKDGNKRMERQRKGSRGLEAYCKGGQGPPRAVAPPKKNVCYVPALSLRLAITLFSQRGNTELKLAELFLMSCTCWQQQKAGHVGGVEIYE